MNNEYADLSNKALKYYEEEDNKEGINSVLAYASLPERISYLQRKGDMQDDLIALYKKHKMRRELGRLYKEKHDFIEAAKVAETLEDKLLLLVQAFKEFAVQPTEEVREKLYRMFTEIIDKIDNVPSSIKSEAYYCYTRLTKNTRYMTNTIRLFNILNDILGQLVCFKSLIQLDVVNQNGCFRSMFQSYRKLEELIKSTFSLIDDLTKEHVEKDWINLCLEKLGYRRVDKNEYRIEDHSSYKFYLSLAKIDYSRSMVHKISKTQAKTMAVKVFMSLLRDLIRSFREVVAQQVVLSTVCQVSNNKCSDRTCKKLHQCPTLDTFSNGIKALFSSLFISGLCMDAKQNLSTLHPESTQWIDLSSTDLYQIHTLLQAHKPFLHIIKSEGLSSLFSVHYKSKKTLFDIMRFEWKEKVKKKSIEMDSYNGLSFISYLLDKSKPVIDELRASKKEKYYTFNLFNMFNDSLESLYFDCHVRKFITTTITLLNNCSTLVSADTFCDLLEIPILLLLSCISATASPRRRYPFVIPYSYMQQRDLWDSLYSRRFKFKQVVARLVRSQHNWNTFASFTEDICKIFINPKVFQTLVKLFMKQDSHKTNLEIPISRMLCLYLVVLSNLQQGLMDVGKPLEIVTLFREPLQVKSQSFLTSIFLRIGQLKNCEESKKILSDLLKPRNDYLQQYDWDSSKQRLVMPGGISPASTTEQPFVKILKRGEDFIPKEKQVKEEIIDEEDDDYYRKGVGEEEQEVEDQVSLQRREMREKEAKERAIANKVKEKWNLLVRRKRNRRTEVLNNCTKIYCGIRIKNWWKKYRTNSSFLDSSLSDQEPEEYDERYFKNGECSLCRMRDAQNKHHIESKLHLGNVDLFEKHEALVELFDRTNEKYVSLDYQDNDIDNLGSQYNTQYKILELGKKMAFPYSEQLRLIVDRFREKCNILGKLNFYKI